MPPPVTVALMVTGTPGHTVVGPVAVSVALVGVNGFTVTDKDTIEDWPHTFCPRTLIVPPVLPTVTPVLDAVEPPVHPVGNVHT